MKRASILLALGFFIIVTILTLVAVNLTAQTFGTPTGDVLNDGQPVTVGLRFTPKANAIVTGGRFHRRFTGNVTVTLWQNGNALASVSSNSSSIGWQTATFNASVPLAAGQEYVISYHSESGSYESGPYTFPYSGPLYTASSGRYSYGMAPTWPVNQYGNNQYFVEPVIQAAPVPQPPSTTIIRDTIYIPRDTCTIDYSKLADLSFVIMMPEIGGTAYIPDSTTVYKAIFGAAQPHIRFKDDASLRLYRFSRTYTISGVATSVRFTLYKTGAWIRERQINGVWTIWPY